MTKAEKGFTSTTTSLTATATSSLGQLHSQLLPVFGLGAIGPLDGGLGGALLHEGDEGVALAGVGDLGDGSKLFESFLEGKKRLLKVLLRREKCTYFNIGILRVLVHSGDEQFLAVTVRCHS